MDEQLIELVRNYEELYDHGHKRYNDFLAKDKIWKAIGEKMNKSGHKCKMRWSSLRDQYRRYMKRQIHTDQEGPAKGKWRYAEEMMFVRPFLRERDLTSANEEDRWNNEDPEEGDEEDVSPAKRFRAESDLDQGIDDSSSRIIRPRSPSPARTAQGGEGGLLELTKYLVDSNDRKIKEELKSLDATDLFFQSLAATVKKLTPYNQNLCKTKLFQTVMEIELTQILEQYPASTTANNEISDIKIDNIASL